MKSEKEILDFLEGDLVRDTDSLNHIKAGVIPALSFKNAQRFLFSCVTEEDFKRLRFKDDKSVITCIKSYLVYAKENAEKHNLILSYLNIQYFIGLFFLIDDEMCQRICRVNLAEFADYGKPILRDIEEWLSKHNN